MTDTIASTSARRTRATQLTIDDDRLRRVWSMTPAQRRQAAQQGTLSLGEMLRWAARFPREVPLVDGEFFFITAHSADSES